MNFNDAVKKVKPVKQKRCTKSYYLTVDAIQKIKDLSEKFGLSQNVTLESIIAMVNVEETKHPIGKQNE